MPVSLFVWQFDLHYVCINFILFYRVGFSLLIFFPLFRPFWTSPCGILVFECFPDPTLQFGEKNFGTIAFYLPTASPCYLCIKYLMLQWKFVQMVPVKLTLKLCIIQFRFVLSCWSSSAIKIQLSVFYRLFNSIQVIKTWKDFVWNELLGQWGSIATNEN